MRSFIIALCIAAAMIAGSLIYTNSVERISKNLINGNETVINLLEEEDFEGAEHAAQALSDYFDEKVVLLSATGNHEELDKLEIYISELLEYIRGNHKSDALAHCKALNILYEHLPKNYRLKPENILKIKFFS